MRLLSEKYCQLPPNKLLEVKGFVYDCNRLNGFESQLHWECIQNRATDLPCDFLYYYDNKLIAITCMYHFNIREIEVDILIHPSIKDAYLCIFDDIYKELMLELKKQPIYSLIFRFHRLNIGLQGCLRDAGALYKSSDYTLCLTAALLHVSTRIYYKIATANELDEIFLLQSSCFANTLDVYKNRIEGNLCDNRRKIYLFYDQGCNNLLGKIHIRKDEHTSVIHDFCVIPAEQHKGYGCEILKVILPVIFITFGKTISLEIENKNEQLVKLYTKFNFAYSSVFDYWQLSGFRKPEVLLLAK